MKILFLDIDGVMNCRETVRYSCKYQTFDQKPTDLLRDILSTTGAHVVISSSWRITIPIDEFRRIFDRHGLPGARIIGYTPRLFNTPSTREYKRGEEIERWLEQHTPRGTLYAIIDDGDDMEPLGHRLARTSSRTGLTEVVAEQVIRLLT